ncbi:hypothetical protein C5E08_03885 [Rathayibacter iranicus]|uniref:Uncharacterized protein n=2 Tax=Rathayibacter iranicus TaxID=59737 RepID=A0AAD1ELK6_9MICO|nr:hypothetical protein C7V51_03900 [Rathayibacter iranicus]PPI49438.1 hypothetical protein C5E09_02975 [Rathayibacter iranicus]PPI61802.1 hypothetical protein C5E08_03885 [Rathayibacter iranicus]PPI73377.1 hypothetical protein C5E01_02955 [Rathayibacter iranicus]
MVLMNDATMDIVTGIAVPAASILISTWVAIRLARSERKAAAAARVEERIDAAFARALTALATLNTINLRAESIAKPMRELRVALTLLDAATPPADNDLLAEWFEAERLAGTAQGEESRRLLDLVPQHLQPDADVEKVVAAGAPVNTWARDFANNLRLWRRRGASDAELRSLIDSAKARLTGASSA